MHPSNGDALHNHAMQERSNICSEYADSSRCSWYALMSDRSMSHAVIGLFMSEIGVDQKGALNQESKVVVLRF